MITRFVPRSYLHFDSPINRQSAQKLVEGPQTVGRHSFFPFISYVITTQKVRKKEGGGVELRDPKDREIAYAAHRDSHIFAHYAEELRIQYEELLTSKGLTNTVTAFRRVRRTHEGRVVSFKSIHFADEAFEAIKRMGPCSVLAMDVSDFFGNLDHKLLKDAWCNVIGETMLPEDHYAVFKAVTRYSKVDRYALYETLGIDPLHPRRGRKTRLCTALEFRNLVRGGGLCQVNKTGKGIPQGSPISAMLSNIYMLGFDEVMKEFASINRGLYRRYCDDILLILPTAELRKQGEELILQLCSDLKLPINLDKTERIDFEFRDGKLTTPKPLQYLGFTFDGRNKRVRPASVARYYKKMRKGVARTKAIRFRADREKGLIFTTWLRRKKLFIQYTYLGRHNFPAYVFEAARIMNEPRMKRQIKPHMQRLKTLIGESKQGIAVSMGSSPPKLQG